MLKQIAITRPTSNERLLSFGEFHFYAFRCPRSPARAWTVERIEWEASGKAFKVLSVIAEVVATRGVLPVVEDYLQGQPRRAPAAESATY